MSNPRLAAQIAVGHIKQNQCPVHSGKQVEFICDRCEEIVCIDCVRTVHKKHAVHELRTRIPDIKQKIQDFVRKAKENDIVLIAERIEAVKDDVTNNKRCYTKMISDILEENTYVKNELDKLTERFVETCLNMERADEQTLLNHKEELLAKMDELNSKIQECTEILQTANYTQLHGALKNIQKINDQLPTKPEFPTVQFVPSISKSHYLQRLIGELLAKRNGYPSEPIALQYTPPIWRETSMFTPYQEDTVSFNTDAYVTSMHISLDDQIWFCERGKDVVRLTDNTGGIQKEHKLKTDVYDFCLSPRTQDIWFTSFKKRSVSTIRAGKSFVMFRTDVVPLSICVTNDDSIIIGHVHQLVKYSHRGNIVIKTSRGMRYSPPPVIYPRHIAECPVTHNIAMADEDRKGYGGVDAPFVAILNDKLQVLYTFRGDRPGYLSLSSPFNPQDVCYTRRGELLVAVKNYKSVLAVSGNGDNLQLQTLYTCNTSAPVAVCVFSDDTLIVSFDDGSVKVLQK